MNLTPEEKELGKQNFLQAVGGLSRRDMLKAATAGPALGAMYFGYAALGGDPVRAAIIGTGNQGNALLSFHNRQYIDIVQVCDIRPTSRDRAEKTLLKHPEYGPNDVKKVKFLTDYQDVMKDPSIEMVLIAVPLHMHAPVALAAMAAGKHVFCEKLMAWSVADCKKMCRASAGNAKDGNKLQVAIGHQRHYSVLYDHAVELIQGGVLGDIRHIRARWHRNNTFPGRDGWKPDIPDGDKNVDIEKYGYKSLNEMIRWRLYDRTGGGLMAELGSHQLDACSIFLGKIHPTAVQGVGGKYYYNDEREIADHVYVMFEFEEANNTVVNYSSINTNRYDDYGEIVYGTRGTLLLERETQAMLFKENDPNERNRKPDRQTAISVSRNAKGDPAVDSHGSPDPMAAASAQVGIGAKVSRGYREELEHLAYCIRNPDPSNTPKCHPKVALTDAVIALTSNLAMKHQTRIVFKDAWFDPDETAVPEDEYNGSAGQVAGKP